MMGDREDKRYQVVARNSSRESSPYKPEIRGKSGRNFDPLLFRPLIEQWPIGHLRPNPSNPRTHSPKQIAMLAASMREIGNLWPIIVDESGLILAGHARLAAARVNGSQTVAVIPVHHLTPELKRAFILADNKFGEMAGWDEGLLRAQLSDLVLLHDDLEIEITGFETAEVDRLLYEVDGSNDPADDLPEIDDTGPAVSRVGDIWRCGPHKLACGDARDRKVFDQLLCDETAEMVFTDPPYNVPIKGHVVGKGQTQHREFVMGAGELAPDEFNALLSSALHNCALVSANGSIHFVCMDWRHGPDLIHAALPTFGPPKQLCVWVKSNGGMGSFYRSQHEFVYVFKTGDAPHINNFGLGESGRYRTNVWHYPGVNSFGRNRSAELRMHPTVKPVALVADAIRDCSKLHGVILDPFAGSGTTLIAAERTKRVARLIELDPLYCDVIVRRWQAFSGQSAVLFDGGDSFSEVERKRDVGRRED